MVPELGRYFKLPLKRSQIIARNFYLNLQKVPDISGPKLQVSVLADISYEGATAVCSLLIM